MAELGKRFKAQKTAEGAGHAPADDAGGRRGELAELQCVEIDVDEEEQDDELGMALSQLRVD